MSFVNGFKLLILFALVGWAVVFGPRPYGPICCLSQSAARDRTHCFRAIAGGVMSAFFSFGGWWEASKIAGEIRNPKRTLPLAFVGGVTLVTVIYLLISATFLAVLPLAQVTSNTAFVAQFGGVLFGAAGARVLSACVLVCVCGGIAAITMAAPTRVLCDGAVRRLFFDVRKVAPPLRNAGECRAAANRAGAGCAFPRRFRPGAVLHHLFGSHFSGAGRFDAFPAERAGKRDGGFPSPRLASSSLSTLVALLILMHDPVAGVDWGGHCPLRHPLPQISSPSARGNQRGPAP